MRIFDLIVWLSVMTVAGIFSKSEQPRPCCRTWGKCDRRSGNLGGTGYRSNPHMCDVTVFSSTTDHPSKANPHVCIACGENKTSN